VFRKIIRSIIEFVKRMTGVGKIAGSDNPGATHITDGMEVMGSCGNLVGAAECVENERLKLDGHFIPAKWIERVDKRVHLTKTSQETKSAWTTV
jgi:hypothetical protein